jgi:cytochrome c-type protein NapB
LALAVLALGVSLPLSFPELSGAAAQQAGEVQSLRGETAIPDENLAPENRRQDTRAGAFSRAYRQQPPLIPHRVEGYQISRTVNQCMHCHDWPYNVQEGAPKISETHYVNRDGIALDKVTPGRWFCNQCHVPQLNARELVTNDFKSAKDLNK